MADTADQLAATLAEWRKTERAATPGPWTVETESCDCGGDCEYPRAIRTSRPHTERPTGQKHPDYDFSHSEICELSDEDVKFIVKARRAMPRLIAAIEAALKLAEPAGEIHRDLDGNEEFPLVQLVRCDVLRAAIMAALTGEADGEQALTGEEAGDGLETGP